VSRRAFKIQQRKKNSKKSQRRCKNEYIVLLESIQRFRNSSTVLNTASETEVGASGTPYKYHCNRSANLSEMLLRDSYIWQSTVSSVDSWEPSQASWVKTIKVLHHLSNKVKVRLCGLLNSLMCRFVFFSESFTRIRNILLKKMRCIFCFSKYW